MGKIEVQESQISFSKKDDAGIHPHDNDLMVITVRYGYWDIIRVLVNLGSFAYILYWDAFEELHLNLDDLNEFQGSLVGFLGNQVHMKGYITLKTMLRA